MTSETQSPKGSGGYARLLRDRSFQSFLWTQFLAAFNDNVYKMIVSVGAVELAADQLAGARYLAIAGAVFTLPFVLFAGYAGQIADRFSKTRVLQVTKAFEIVIMLFGIAALQAGSINMLLIVLFLLALQANMFSPAKYAILPEMLAEAQLSRANGLLEFSTFIAIILGTSVGTLLFAHLKHQPLAMGGILLGIAILGSLTSLFIRKVPSSGSRETFHWNPFREVWAGTKRIYQNRPMWLTVAGMSYFWFTGALFQLNVILLGSESLHLTETRTGLLVTALAVGIGGGSVAAGWLSGDNVEIGLVPLGAALLGIFSLVLGTAHSFPVAAVWLAAAGFAGGLFVVPLNAFLQEEADSKEKGRVLATNSFLNAIAIVAASGLLYLLHDLMHWTPSVIFVALGVLTLASTAYMAWVAPASVVRFLIWCVTQVFFKVRIVGANNLPKRGGALIVSNHVSYADAVLIGCASPRLIRFLMWQPLYENKLLNPICRLFKTIPLVQGAKRESLRSLRLAQEELSSGSLVCIFPEGGLTPTSHVMPFHRGVEMIARGIESTPIVPVYLDGLWGHALSLKGGRPFASRLRLRHPVTIYIGEPIANDLTAAELHERILELGCKAANERKDATATLPHRFIRAARKNWFKLAIADSNGRRLSFGKTLTSAIALKHWIKANCSQSNCIGLLLPPSVGGALANLGVTLSGKTAVNLNFNTGADQMRYSIAKCGITVILSSRAFLEKAHVPELPGMVFLEDVIGAITFWEKLRAAVVARFAPSRSLAGSCKPDDIAAIIFSSGSTGTPKGVLLSHWNLIANAEAAGQVYSVGPKDCMLGALPFFHSFGYLYTLWFPALHGFKAVFHSNPLDAKVIGELAAAHRPTLFLATPTFCLSYLRKCTREQFASIRHFLVGAEKLRPALADAFAEKLGLTLLEGYGCTEMGPAVSVNVNPKQTGRAYKPGSVGRPLPNVVWKIVDPDTFELMPEGATGLLLVNGPSRMAGYLDDAERTSASLHHGYYITGDLAYVDPDGFLYIADRLSRFSKIAGEMVPHLKIEDALVELLGPGRCVVTGIPDERRGERLAVIYSSSDVSPIQMVRHLESKGLPPLWIPKRDQFCQVDTIPMLGSGKVDLAKVRVIAVECTESELVLS
jgi:acyl-[acyl-carrier-protein]-phospholipid O-acyltransferase/long-chain-fatty-acid--[acyl-carrier-protein] ligase